MTSASASGPAGGGAGDSEVPVPARPLELEGKAALVTGGGTGFGREIAILFAREGAKVVVAGRRSEPLQDTIREIRRAGGVATFARGDVGRADKVDLIVQSAIYNLGGIDILVNNAAIFLPGTVETTDERRWDKVMSANLKGPYLISRLAVPAMRARGGGAIVNVAAAAGLVGQRGAAAFAASKGGLVALTRSMALDCAQDGIRVNVICPGADAESSGEAGRKFTPKAGEPKDVAHLALYLASEEAAGVTGRVFSIRTGEREE